MRFVNSLNNPQRRASVMAALERVALSGKYAEGQATANLEAMFSGLYRGPAVVAFNSCGSALYTLFRYLQIKGHTHIAVQNNTFYATGAMAVLAGLDLYLVDSGDDCPSMSAASLEDALKADPKISCVVLTHVGGWLAKHYGAIAEICHRKQLVLVEDCAHALGLLAEPLPGSLGFAACWSFYPTKAVPAGEGGLLSTKDVDLAQFARTFRSYGKKRDSPMVTYDWGMNLRMSEWDAAVACVQLDFLAAILQARRRDAKRLQSIAKCLLTGESNYYKFPVTPFAARNFITVGGVYAASDQLTMALPRTDRVREGSLLNSRAWAMNHKCLPVGEGLYDGMTESVLRIALDRTMKA